MINLIKNLTAMEKNNSPLEVSLRHMNIPVLKAFCEKGTILPKSFIATEKKFLMPPKKSIMNSFPYLIKNNRSQILEAKGASMEFLINQRIAVLFSGGPAAGGHNVVAGIKKILGKNNILYGIKSGPKGLLNGDFFELTDEMVNRFFNMGGFDLLGSDRTKIQTKDQYKQVLEVIKTHNLQGLIIIGGDDSNTNAAFLAEYLYPFGCRVIGVPKTIDGDLQFSSLLPISFGFDTATKIYAELVGNVLQDTPSSRKYWHFIKLMGRSASHVALEVALQTRAPITLISEEIAKNKMTLNELIERIARIIAIRAAKNINYGVVIVPEGLIEFIPEFHQLIKELNDTLAESQEDLRGLNLSQKLALVKLSKQSASLLGSLPETIENKLFLDRDSHGNLQVSQIPTEQLLIEMTEKKIFEMKNNPTKYFGKDKLDLTDEEIAHFYKFKFQTNSHFFGYEGRCGAPSFFDAVYTYNLGLAAGSLILQGKTGYMVSITDFDKGGTALALPLHSLLTIERRHGKDSLVIKKALIDLDSPAFKYFNTRIDDWSKSDLFTSPGPRQWFGANIDQMPYTVALNQQYNSYKFKINH